MDKLSTLEPTLDPNSDEACLICVTRRDYERATEVPAKFLAEASAHFSQTYHQWSEARPNNDFKKVKIPRENPLAKPSIRQLF